MIQYYSTKDSSKTKLSFKEALLTGLAPDGGLYVPDSFPKFDFDTLSARSMAEIGSQVLYPYMQENIEQAELDTILKDALNFPAPLHKLDPSLYVLELFHGPTLSFKDFAARTMARLMSSFLAQENRKVTIVVATSGDTGSAVADGFAGQDNIDVVLLYPKGLVSEVQERQLIVKRPGVRSLAVQGSFDDCQSMVKAAFVDPDLADVPLSSANSINIGRLLPQMLYYIWAVKQAVALNIVNIDSGYKGHKEVNICVPSGNLGNFSAGFIATKMGLPVKQFVVTHNANHFFPKYLAGDVSAFEFNKTVATLSNAMDVGSPSNFERLHHLFGDEHLRNNIWSTTISDETTQTAMQNIHRGFDGYIACPHTAVGLQAVLEYRNQTGDTTPFISMATAHPAKFPDALEGVGIEVPTEPALQKLFAEETNVQLIPAEVDALKKVLLESAA